MKWIQQYDSLKMYIWMCFLSQFFFTLIFTVSLLYQVKIVELNPMQLILIGTVLELTVFLFEIPTGVVADLKSRKLSIIIGYLLIGIGFLIEGLFPFFVAVLVAQILWGIGYTFTSGAKQAWIADELGEERTAYAFIKGAKAEQVGQLVAIPISMLIGFYLINLPIIIGGVSLMGLALFLILFMKETNFKRQEVEVTSTWQNMKNTSRKIVVFSKASVLMRILLLIALFVGLYSEGFDRLWLTHLFDHPFFSGVADIHSVFIVGSIQFVLVTCSFIALHFLNRSNIYMNINKIYVMLLICSIIILLSLIGFSLSKYVIALFLFYLLIEVARQITNPLSDIWLNKLIVDSSTRATFFSVKGQVDAIGQISGGPFIGIIAVSYSIKMALLICALFFSPVLWLYRVVLKKGET